MPAVTTKPSTSSMLPAGMVGLTLSGSGHPASMHGWTGN
jgi:hypothetical protein